MIEKISGLQEKYDGLQKQLSDPEVISDMKKYVQLNKEYKELAPIIEAGKVYKKMMDDYDSAKDILANEKDEELREMAKEEIAGAIRNVLGEEIAAIYDKSAATAPYKAGLDLKNGYLYCREETGFNGTSGEEIVRENGNSFYVNWIEGQKTGFFVDQRDNRALLERYARGREVLNMFCYTGGFSVYALRGGAKLVHSVDSSSKAIDLTRDNVALNFPGDTRHEAFAEDAFKYLDAMGHHYDLIVLDPPAFAKHRDALRQALKGYTRLNAKAFEKIKPGGILFTFSCSQVVSKDQFRTAIFTAAAQSKRRVRILHQLHQPADHPIDIYHPEGEYLKGLVLFVE